MNASPASAGFVYFSVLLFSLNFIRNKLLLLVFLSVSLLLSLLQGFLKGIHTWRKSFLNSLAPSSLPSCSFFNLLDLAEGGDIAILMEGGVLFLAHEIEVFSWRSFAFLIQLLVVRNDAASGSLLPFCVCIPFVLFEINPLPIHFNLDLIGFWFMRFNLFILLAGLINLFLIIKCLYNFFIVDYCC